MRFGRVLARGLWILLQGRGTVPFDFAHSVDLFTIDGLSKFAKTSFEFHSSFLRTPS